ncbi:chloride channel protein 3 [Neurospora crassa OR74A]|uniref:Chloride channel protein n=1 Tax=Neurospora crassa (strain ATCC 24698 / 74-OR23-1A / CBS 708.71 / DSM 1257 / FGSC 987) TaxID=367110 RepID=Q7RYX3_NEUCR|nr:chloride channel protein 3 [Neurospora crassa OR74A]EAA28099.2 chloride channel protein 3 [Neurospora crassa OR74A]|eukprot:XP_957335.2 chloride channel protein 3 [Neurospora crassa OR74A]
MASRSARMDDGYPSSSATPAAFDSQHEWEEHRRATIEDDRDELDLLGEDNDHNNNHDNDNDMILDEDPLRDDLDQPMSFKRRQKKQSVFSQPSRLFSALTGGRSPRTSHDVPGRPSPTSNTRLDGTQSGSKDGGPMDWYVEGPGRRVGYEDLTAIDWIFEYTKERSRLRMLSSGSNSLVGRIRLLLDNSQVWIVLLLAGLAAGLLAAAIDVATDWLADLKFGFCSTVDGGAFHLSKSSCCLGYEDHAQCQGWYPWAKAFGIYSGGGKWFLEYFFYVFLALSFAVSAAILVKEYAIHAKHSGIPEIKTVLGGFVIRRFLGIQTLVTKSLGLVLAVASGMWLGKEGPLVHVACCCANVFIKLFPSINNNEARKREILSAAAAAGISVAFGSPIGGVLFSLEQLSYYFPDKTMWQSFVCAMTAAVTLQALDPFRSGKLVLYQVKYSSGWHGFELVPFVLLGILGGVYGGLFIKANMRVAEWKKSTRWLPGPVTQVAIVAALTALINYPNHYMRAQTSELVSNLFTECAKIVDDQFGLCKTGAASFGTITLLIFAAVLGFFFAAVTFGLQIPAGIILPSMAIGALTGRALGILMELFQRAAPNFPLFLHQCEPDVPCITPGTYAIIGAAAFLTGVTRMTVSIVVITFELTGALTYVLPIMISVMIAKWVGDAFSRRGIYESWIHFNSYPYLDPNNSGEDLSPLIPDVPASQIMTRLDSDLIVLTATGHTIASLQKILETTPYRGYPVISNPRDAVLLGYISRAELSYVLYSPGGRASNLPPETECFFSHQPLADPLTTLDLRPWMDQTPLTLPGRSPLHLAVSYFQKLGVRYVLFAERGVLQGLLTRKDVWHVMNGAEERVRDAVGAGGAGGTGSGRMGSGLGRQEGRGESAGLLGVERRDYFQGQGGTREGRSGSFAGSSQGSIL